MSCILKFITFTLEVKRRLWSASHPETVVQRSLFVSGLNIQETRASPTDKLFSLLSVGDAQSFYMHFDRSAQKVFATIFLRVLM